MDYLERLVDANAVRGQARLKLLEAADAELDKVRLYLRLAHNWRWITPGQYECRPPHCRAGTAPGRLAEDHTAAIGVRGRFSS